MPGVKARTAEIQPVGGLFDVLLNGDLPGHSPELIAKEHGIVAEYPVSHRIFRSARFGHGVHDRIIILFGLVGFVEMYDGVIESAVYNLVCHFLPSGDPFLSDGILMPQGQNDKNNLCDIAVTVRMISSACSKKEKEYIE